MFTVEPGRCQLRQTPQHITVPRFTLGQAREVRAVITLLLQGQSEQERGRHLSSASVDRELDFKPVWVEPEPGLLASS